MWGLKEGCLLLWVRAAGRTGVWYADLLLHTYWEENQTIFRQQLLRSLLGAVYPEKAICPPSEVLGFLTCLGRFRRHEFGPIDLMDRGLGWDGCREIPYYTKKWACVFE